MCFWSKATTHRYSIIYSVSQIWGIRKREKYMLHYLQNKYKNIEVKPTFCLFACDVGFRGIWAGCCPEVFPLVLSQATPSSTKPWAIPWCSSGGSEATSTESSSARSPCPQVQHIYGVSAVFMFLWMSACKVYTFFIYGYLTYKIWHARVKWFRLILLVYFVNDSQNENTFIKN